VTPISITNAPRASGSQPMASCGVGALPGQPAEQDRDPEHRIDRAEQRNYARERCSDVMEPTEYPQLFLVIVVHGGLVGPLCGSVAANLRVPSIPRSARRTAAAPDR